jgi:GAF domain-containing protein
MHTTSIKSALRAVPWALPLIGTMSINRQYQILGALAGLCLVVAALLFYASIRETTNTAFYLTTATEMQMLSQRLAKGAQQAVLGNISGFEQLQQSRDAFVANLNNLIYGSARAPAATRLGTVELDKINQSWAEMEQQVSLILAQETELVSLAKNVLAINDDNPRLLELAQEVESTLTTTNAPVRVAGLLVMLTQKLVKNANALLSNELVDPEVAFLLAKDTNTFRDNLLGLINGSQELNIAPVQDQEGLDRLKDLENAFKKTEDSVASILKNQQKLIQAKRAGQSIFIDSEKLLASLQNLTDRFQAEAEKRGMLIAAILSAVLTLIFLALMGFASVVDAGRRLLERKLAESIQAAQPLLKRSLQLSEVYPTFAGAVRELLDYDRIGVVVPEGERLVMTLSVAEPPLASWRGESWPQTGGTAVGWVMTHQQPRLVRDLVTTQHEFSDEAFLVHEGVRASLMIPLLVGGKAVGVFLLDSLTPGAYTEEDLNLVEPVAQQLALAIENTQLFKELQNRSHELARSVEELQVLRRVGEAVNSTLDLQTVLTTIVAHAVQLSGTDGGAIYEYDEQSEEFILRATHGMDEGLVKALRANPVRLGEGSVGQAAVARKPIAVSDIEAAIYEPRLRSLLGRYGFQAVLSIPLLREDHVVGGFSVARKSPGEFSPEIVDLMRAFASQSVLAIQNARLFREIEEKGRQLETASRHKSQFLANMSHELRTPLNAILGYTELILDNIYGEVPQPVRDALTRLVKNGHHLLGLINNVLDLSKIEAGSLKLTLGDYAMNEVVHTAITSIEPLAKAKKLALKVTVPVDLPRGRGDEQRLTQVLLNLVGNAIKFTETGEVRVYGEVLSDLGQEQGQA